MSEQTTQKNGASTNGTLGKGFRFAAATAAVIIMTVFAAGTAAAGNLTQNVNVVNTPTVNANATITAPGPLTNVGRLASQQLTLKAGAGTCTGPNWLQLNADGSTSCFDMANYPGQALVITDVYWRAAGTPGNTCFTDLQLPPNDAVVISSSTVAAADNFAANSEHLTTGVAMTVNPTLRAFGLNCFSQEYQMHGYLVPNK